MEVCSRNLLLERVFLIFEDRNVASTEANVAVTAEVGASTMAMAATARNCVRT